MKKLLVLVLTVSLASLATSALAERGYGRGDHGYYASQGDRIERHLDRKGDRIERMFDHKADRAEYRGKFRKADHFRAKGDRIDRHLDRKGKQIHARHDRHMTHRHYKPHRPHIVHKYYRGHQHHYPRPRVVYRDYDPYDTYFGLVINQPGLWLGWGWYD